MSVATEEERETRVLLLAPPAGDAEVCRSALDEAHVAGVVCDDVETSCREIEAGAGAVLLDEESLGEDGLARLQATLSRQPEWSDLPVLVVVASGAGSTIAALAPQRLGNALLLERPVHVASLLSAVRMALRSRRRQYRIRDDLLERQRREAAFAEHEERLRLIADNVPAIIAYVDRDRRFRFISKEYEHWFGAPAASVIGRHVAEVLGPERYARARPHVDLVLSAGEPASYENVIHRADGSTAVVLVHYVPHRREGRILGFYALLSDVTELKRAEEALARSRAEFQAMFSSISEAVLFADTNRRIVMVNPAFTRVFGYAPEEAEGRSVEFLYADKADYEEQGRLRYRDGIEPERRHYEIRYRRKDGSAFLAESLGDHVRDGEGRLIGFVSLHRDITERKRAEEELQRRERDYRTLAENLPGLIYRVFLRENLRTHFYNDLLEPMTGYTEEELRAGEVCSIDPLIEEEDRPHVVETVRRAVADHQPFEMTYRLRHKNGDIRQFSERGRPIHGKDGRPLYIDGVVFDVTERRRAEEALLASDRRLRLALDAGRMGTWDWEVGTQNAEWSDGYYRLMGYQPGEIEATYDAFRRQVHPDDLERQERAACEAAERRGEYSCEYRVVWPDGSIHWIEARGRYVYDESGVARRMYGVVLDIDEKKQAEEALRRAKAAAEEASMAKSRFLANTSHELRTPMNAILGMTDLALGEAISPTVRDYLQTAHESAHSLLDLLNQLLDLSRIEAGRFELEATPFQLRTVVEQVIRTLGVRAYEKGLELCCELPDSLPEHLVGDPLRLRQILVNLVGNAVKFTSQGEVLLGVAVASEHDGTVELRFSVADTGIGIAPEDQERIFAPFLQADASTTRHYGGSGLGLAIAANLVERMGGRMWVESRLGHGTTFHFTVRLARSPQFAEEADERPVNPNMLRDLPVLVATGHRTGRRILQQTLAGWSMNVEAAVDGPAAWTKIQQAAAKGGGFRLILADALTPAIDGYALAERLRGEAPLAAPVILMASAAERRRHPRRWRDVGALCLQKPILPSDLLDVIAEALGIADRRASHAAAGALSPTPPARTLTVLLAEDTPANQKLVARILDRRGHRVEVAGHGREAVELLQRRDFDLVLMDVQMPVMDGFQATEAIRGLADAAKARVPIVAMTAHALTGDAQRCLTAGMDAYLAKPIEAPELVALVERLGGGEPPAKATDRTGDALPPAPEMEPTPTGTAEAASPAASLPAVFDEDEAVRKCFGEYRLLREMVGCLFDEGDDLIEEMHDALADGDAEQLARAVHRLKNTVVYLGALPATEATRAVERVAMLGDLAGAGEAVARLAQQLQLLKQAVAPHRPE